jgi:type IV pilus assembly protein PilM
MLRKTRQLVGVDIGSSAVKVVELKAAGNTFSVVAFGTAPTPPGAIVDDAIEDATAVAEVLRRLCDSHGIRSRHVAAAISGHGVFVKSITLPLMTDLELAASIGWEVEQHIALAVEDVHFDYHRFEETEVEADRMEILLVAARRTKVAEHARVISQAGRRPTTIDVAAFALQNVYEANYEIDANTVIALVDAGASTISVHVFRRGRMLFTHSVAASGDVMADIGAALDVFSQSIATPFDRIITTGGASRIPGLAGALATRVGVPVPVEPLDPFRRIVFDETRFGADATDVAATAAIAVGLALRRRNDR